MFLVAISFASPGAQAEDREATLRFNTASRLYRQANWPEAHTAFGEFLGRFRRHEKAGEAYFARGYCAMRLDRIVESASDFERAIKSSGAASATWFADAHFYLGQARERQADTHRDDLALRSKTLRTAAKSFGDAASAWQKRMQGAGSVDERRRVHSSYGRALAAQGEALFQAGDVRRAQGTLAPFVSTDSPAAWLESVDAKVRSRALYFLGLAHYADESRIAKSSFSSTLRALEPLITDSQRGELWEEAAFLGAQVYARTGDAKRAVVLYERVVEQGGDRSPEAHYRLALTRYDSGVPAELETAARELRDFRRQRPRHAFAAEAARFEALSLFRLERYEEAARVLTELIADESAAESVSSAARLTLGQALLLSEKADPVRAVRVLEEAVKTGDRDSKDDVERRFWLAEAHLAVGERESLQSAMQIFQNVATSSTKAAQELVEEALIKQADVAYRLGEHRLCAETTDRYRRRYPADQARFYLASLKLSGRNALYAPDETLPARVRDAAADYFEEAASLVTDKAESIELQYFAAVATYRAGDFDDAAGRFARVHRARIDLGEELPALDELSFYLGDALAQPLLRVNARRSEPTASEMSRAKTAVQWFAHYLARPGRKSAATARLQTGLLFERIDALEEARDAYRQFIKEHPSDEHASKIRYALADVYLKLEDVTSAAEAYRDAAETGEKLTGAGARELAARAYLQAARLQRQLGEADGALKLLGRAGKVASAAAGERATKSANKLHAQIAFERASTLLSAERVSDAAKAFAAYLKEHPRAERAHEARVELAYLLVEGGGPSEALEVVAPLVEGDASRAERADALYIRAWALSDLASGASDAAERAARLRDAEKAYESVLRDHPKVAIAAEARLELAQLLFNRGELKRSGTEFERLLAGFTGTASQEQSEAASTSPGRSELKAQAEFGLAFVRYQTKDYTAARALFDSVAESTSGDPATLARAVFHSGRSWMLSRGVREAQRRFERLVDELKDHAGELYEEALLRLGECYHRVQEYSSAARAYKRQLDEFPRGERRHEARFGLGFAYQFLDRPDDARKLFEEVTRDTTAPVAARAQYHIGECYMDGDMHREAARAFLAVVASFDFDGAYRPWFRRALLAAGIAYAAAGQGEAALQQWTELVERFPQSDEAAAARRRMQEVNR